MNHSKIQVEVIISAAKEHVWNCFLGPNHIVKWNQASPDWHCPSASCDLRIGGHISSRMESKDGTMGFDFVGVFEEIVPFERIVYSLADGRSVEVLFSGSGIETKVVEIFDPEQENTAELQQNGWQAILDSFKDYVEAPPY